MLLNLFAESRHQCFYLTSMVTTVCCCHIISLNVLNYFLFSLKIPGAKSINMANGFRKGLSSYTVIFSILHFPASSVILTIITAVTRYNMFPSH